MLTIWQMKNEKRVNFKNQKIMKTIKILAVIGVLFFTSFGSEVKAQSKGETGSSQFYNSYDASETGFYGMKKYKKGDTYYLFITDAFKLCSESDTRNLDDDLEKYIEANYYEIVNGADKYLNYGGLTGYTHICCFYEKDNSGSENYAEAKRGRTTAMSEFMKKNTQYGKAKVVKISRLDFDFNLPCD